MSGIKTTFRGIRFRSRIEAKWAAMFDRLGWDWEYEPLDLEGYVPDFRIRGWKKPLIVEVKSMAELEELVPAGERALNSGWDGNVLVVGSGVYPEYFKGSIGLVSNRAARDRPLFAKAAIGCSSRGSECGHLGLVTPDRPSSCYRCGVTDGGFHFLPPAEVHRFWADACNKTQWNPKVAEGRG